MNMAFRLSQHETSIWLPGSYHCGSCSFHSGQHHSGGYTDGWVLTRGFSAAHVFSGLHVLVHFSDGRMEGYKSAIHFHYSSTD